MDIIKIIRFCVPPILTELYRALCRRIAPPSVPSIGLHLYGDFKSWNDAEASSGGYDTAIILEKTKEALLRVKNGTAIYERDSVIFDTIQYSWPVLAGLMLVAARHGGSLNVLDFGGSLGSTYFQNRRFLEYLSEIRWNIIEQPQHVEVGKAFFEDECLRFYSDVDTCLIDNQPNVVILSGILQYIKNPFELLGKLFQTSSKFLIIDRTPFWDGASDRLCVQHVPAQIYSASYPSWIFSKERFRKNMENEWTIISEFVDPDKLPGPVKFSYYGMLLTRTSITT